MNHERRIPAWLLRDLPALAGMFACFWLFVWPLIREGWRIMRGGKPCRQKIDRIANLLINAEATLAFALCREACRRLGYNHRRVKLQIADFPATYAELSGRIRSYLDQVQNLSRAAAHYTELLRQRVGAASVPAHGSTGALRAAHHEAVDAAASSRMRGSPVALILGSAQDARPSKDERGPPAARGPPPDRDLLFAMHPPQRPASEAAPACLPCS